MSSWVEFALFCVVTFTPSHVIFNNFVKWLHKHIFLMHSQEEIESLSSESTLKVLKKIKFKIIWLLNIWRISYEEKSRKIWYGFDWASSHTPYLNSTQFILSSLQKSSLQEKVMQPLYLIFIFMTNSNARYIVPHTSVVHGWRNVNHHGRRKCVFYLCLERNSWSMRIKVINPKREREWWRSF